VFGAMSYTLVSVQGSFMSLRTYNEPMHFTHHTIAHAHLGLYAFFTMVMFGSIYYIVPRLTGREWASSLLIRVHFWAAAIGMAMYFVCLTVGGLIQGFDLNQAETALWRLVGEQGLTSGIRDWFAGFKAQNGAVPFIDVVKGTIPWLVSRSVAGTLMTIGHVAFFILMAMNFHAWGRPRAGKPTLFRENASEYARLTGAGEQTSPTPGGTPS